MDAIKKDFIEAWLTAHDWIKFNEQLTPQGPVHSYLTPAGNLVNLIYKSGEEELAGIGQPPVMAIMPPQNRVAIDPSKLKGPGFTGFPFPH